ncbi:MAG: dihydroorotate dehydrogenase electron transfer subunit [Oscillospiraceae bacterium]|nr:dihydroorotate dehydrogenase electron transfer subunit [Oscillospiraceae bacterium]
MTFDAPEIARAAKPGQFVHIKCGHSRPLRRPISVCDVRGDMLTVVFEVRGAGTRWLASRAVGRKADILGPLGRGFDEPDGKMLLVGGGLGVAPLLFAASRSPGVATAVLGFRSRENAILINEFEGVCEDVFTVTDDGSRGLRGTATSPLAELLRSGKYTSILACGPRAMLSATAELASAHGVYCEVSLEERMGCGVGACLVCACATRDHGEDKMSRVCKDGPVFDSREVVW